VRELEMNGANDFCENENGMGHESLQFGPEADMNKTTLIEDARP
jgi:hypothetical protein